MELVCVLAILTAPAIARVGWWFFSRGNAAREGDAQSSVTPLPDGTVRVTVTNPGPEHVVVTAFARPVGCLRWAGPHQVRRSRRPGERQDSWRAFRHLLGSVPPGGESTWIVVGDVGSPRCRVVLNLYQTAGRVRVHEAVVPTEPLVGRRLGWRDLLRPAPVGP